MIIQKSPSGAFSPITLLLIWIDMLIIVIIIIIIIIVVIIILSNQFKNQRFATIGPVAAAPFVGYGEVTNLIFCICYGEEQIASLYLFLLCICYGEVKKLPNYICFCYGMFITYC